MPQAIYLSKDLLAQTLQQAPELGKRLLEPLKTFSKTNLVPLNILEDHQVSNDVEVHHHEADLWMCLEGEVEFLCGGELVDPWFKQNADGTEDRREVKAKEIRDGESFRLLPGDWLWIPASVPHQHRSAGTARLVIIKVPQALSS